MIKILLLSSGGHCLGAFGVGKDSSTGPSERGQQRREWGTEGGWVLLEGQEGLTITVFPEHLLCARHHSKCIHTLTNKQMYETSTMTLPRWIN